MIQVESVSKGYGGQTVLREVTWRIAERERIGLVGPNGAGKTTMCRILAGIEEPDTGRVSRPRHVTVGYLPQEVAGGTTGSVLAEALGGFEALGIEYVDDLEAVAENYCAFLRAEGDDAHADAILARLGAEEVPV